MKRTPTLACALFAALCAAPALPPARAQPGDNGAPYVDRLEARAADASLSLREREAAADEAIIQRAALIGEAGPDHPRRAEWCTTQASAVLARLRRDGSDTAVLFGIPTPAQREQAQAAAGEAAHQLASAAEALRAHPERAEGADYDIRIPFLRARAELLLAALNTGAERARHAAAAYEAAGGTGLSNPGPEAARRVNAGASLLMRAQPVPRADAELAMEEFAWAALGGDDPERPAASIPQATRVEGWFGLLQAARLLGNLDAAAERLRAALAAPPFTVNGRADPLFAVLAADALTRAYFEQGLAAPDAAALERAAAEQAALLARNDLGFRAEILRPASIEKLATLSDSAPPGAALPAAFDLARAIRAARNPEARDEAIERFQRIADRPDAGPAAADALWELAVLLLQPGASEDDHRRAVAALVRLAEKHPAHSRALEAISAALPHARVLPLGLETYFDALVLATDKFPELPKIDLWRYERARLAVAQENEAVLRAALESMRCIREPSPESDRLHERLQAAAIDSLRARLREARARADEPAVVRLAREELEPETRRAVDWASARRAPALPRFRADLADAITDAGRPDAAAHYAALLPAAHEIPGGAPRLKLGQARALLNAGNAAAAFPPLRDAAAALDAAPSADGPARSGDFWHAWTLMLEILARESTGNPERAGAVRAHLRRLESIDPGLGGPPWQQRIRSVRAQVR